MRTRLLLVFSMILTSSFLVIPATTATAQTEPTCGPYVTLTPPFGDAGTQVSVNLFNFAPNDEVDVILRIPGDPVVATGTTDAEGRANIVFTMPEFPGDRVAIAAFGEPCYASGAYFERREVTPTPTPTPIQATATPTATPTQPGETPTPPPVTTVPATPTATPTKPAPTPQAPIAGSGGIDGGFGSTGMNLALVGLALVIFCGAFAIWGSTRQASPARIRNRRDDDIG